MANYKNIVDVDVLAEASESTNVLVEENGSLKKVPASAVGGSAGGRAVLFMVTSEEEVDCNYTPEQIKNMLYTYEFPAFWTFDPERSTAGMVYAPCSGMYQTVNFGQTIEILDVVFTFYGTDLEIRVDFGDNMIRASFSGFGATSGPV